MLQRTLKLICHASIAPCKTGVSTSVRDKALQPEADDEWWFRVLQGNQLREVRAEEKTWVDVSDVSCFFLMFSKCCKGGVWSRGV